MADFNTKKKAEQAFQQVLNNYFRSSFSNITDARLGEFAGSLGPVGSGVASSLQAARQDPSKIGEFLAEVKRIGLDPKVLREKLGIDVGQLGKTFELAGSTDARRSFLQKYDPTTFSNSEEWISSMAEELGPQFKKQTFGLSDEDRASWDKISQSPTFAFNPYLQAAYKEQTGWGSSKGLFGDLDKSGIFGDQGPSEDKTRVADYETKMKEFIAELNKPLDRNDPQVQNLIRTVNTGQLRRQQEMGLGAGGYSAANSERAAMGALTPLQAQRKGQAIDLTGQLMNSALQRQQGNQNLDYQYAALAQQRQLAEQQMAAAQDQASWQSGKENAQAVGGGIGAGGGAAIGAGLGAILAPFTGGASIALGAGLGAGIGASTGASVGAGIGGAAYGNYKPSYGGGGLGGSSTYYGRGGRGGGYYGGSGT